MSWIGWLTRPRKVEEVENTSREPLETITPAAPSTANSPSKTRLYPSFNSPSTTPSAPLLSDAIRDDWLDEAAAAQNNNNRIAEKKLTEKELAKIKEENDRLKSVLQQINMKQSSSSSTPSPSAPYSFQHVGHIPGGNGFLLSIPSISTPTASNSFAPSVPLAPPSTASTSVSSSVPVLKEKQKEKSEDSSVLCHGDLSTVVVKQLKEEENEQENAVALLDLKEMDWWVMVNGTEGVEKSTPSRGGSSSMTTCVEVEDDDGVQREGGLRIVKSHLTYDDEGYVLIDENDFIQALSDFISQSIARQYPEAEKIPPQELQKILRQAFTPIKQPSSIGKAYQWAQFLYQSYSWGSCAWSLYREPFYVKLVLRGAMKAAQWLLVLVI